ncbi:glycoside hydrolase N-terminal domain-containing protein [Luteolibacter algae]|uniref:Glycoside hydrolase N-terminal domain-containing protein n=1 Tax=Luteolibacter algae TaxID=454151 RepID=A0ABW5D673_9BACT
MINKPFTSILIAAFATCGNLWAAKIEAIPLEQRKALDFLPGMCSTQPAGRWDSGLVTGNGIMGASVLGQPYKEKIIFNHERLFRPILDERPLPPKISRALPEVRRLMKEGKSGPAHAYWQKVMAEEGHTEIINTPSYHPAYTMEVTRKDSGDVTDYLRTLDFMSGEVVVRFRNEAGAWLNRTFVSREDNVIVQVFESPDGKPLQLDLRLVDQWQGLGEGMARITTDLSGEWMTARCKYKKTARGYEGTTRVICDSGRVEQSGDMLRCLDAKRVLLLTRITDLEDFEHSQIGEMQASLSKLPADYEQLLERHVKLHRPVMERMAIDLDQSDDRYLSSEELIAKQSEPGRRSIVPALLQKMFYMGRYALLSSSGNYPPPLTGIWNGSHTPAWSGDFTLDTNLNQQIAGANTCALPEALMSYLELIEEIAPSWEVNAMNIYGCRGYLSGVRTAGRENYHTHFDKWPGHCWTAGASWLIYPLYEYYQVTGDKEFLKDRVLPLMEKSVLFYEDFLTEYDQDGRYLFVPSYSPEQGANLSINAVQDIAAAKQAIQNLIDSYQALEINPDRVASLREMLKKFPPYLINESGAFKEWAYAPYSDAYNHRHMSHSYPVWPAHELDWEEHMEMMKAMRVALELKLPQDWSGHNFAIRAFCAARTKYPQLFYQNLFSLMRFDLISPNLVTLHNPGWSPNTDVLCGLPAMISEALVYSKPGVIELLPAWSPDLPNGSIHGIRSRSQASIDSLVWDLEKKRVTTVITSLTDQWITLYVRQGIASIKTDAEMKPAEPQNIARMVHLKKGEPVRLEIQLEKKINDYGINPPAFPLEEAERIHAERKANKQKGK